MFQRNALMDKHAGMLEQLKTQVPAREYLLAAIDAEIKQCGTDQKLKILRLVSVDGTHVAAFCVFAVTAIARAGLGNL